MAPPFDLVAAGLQANLYVAVEQWVELIWLWSILELLRFQDQFEHAEINTADQYFYQIQISMVSKGIGDEHEVVIVIQKVVVVVIAKYCFALLLGPDIAERGPFND